jgi:hypothetical protein
MLASHLTEQTAGDQRGSDTKLAGDKLAMICELKKLEAFQWFKESCLGEEKEEAFQAFVNPILDEADTYHAKKRYLKAKELYDWITATELSCRKSINPRDPAIAMLLQELNPRG